MRVEKAARIVDWKAGKIPGPWRLFVFPTYRCNLKCGYCTKALVPDPPELRKEISDERLLKLVDEAAELGVREWIIGGGGEAMLRRDVVLAMFEKSRGHGMFSVLQTNGTLFRDQDIETLVRIGLNNIGISVDAPDAATNDRIRWQKSFDKIVRAIETINRYKERYNRKNPLVTLTVTVTAMNFDKLADLVELAHRLKINALTFNELYVHHEGMDDYILSEEQQRALPGFATQALEKADALEMATNLHLFIKALGSVQSRELPPPTPERADDISQLSESLCFDPWLSLSIVSSGNVGPCCVFWIGESDNIKDMSLLEAWTGPYMTQVRRQMLGGAPPEPCKSCQSDFIRENWVVRGELAALEATAVTPTRFVRKAVASLQKNGVTGAVKRGQEWLQIRRDVRRGLAAKTEK